MTEGEAALRSWVLGEGGAFHTGCTIGAADGGERGLFATSHLEEGALLLSVPARLLLTAGAARSRGLPASLPEEDLIALLLLAEMARGDASPRAAWIASLPARYDVPLLWPPAHDEALLRCPVLVSRAAAQREAVAARFARVHTALSATDARPPHPLATGLSLRLFCHAVAALESRGVHLADPYLGAEGWAMVPVGDMLNHAPEPHANVAAAYDSAAAAYRFVASRDIHPGEELTLCYGPHDDATLLLSYGFVLGPLRNPHARAQLPESALAPDPRDADWLADNGMLEDEYGGGSFALSVDGPGWNLLAAMRLGAATEEEREGGAAFAILEGEPVGIDAEARAWRAVHGLAQQRLDTWQPGDGVRRSDLAVNLAEGAVAAGVADEWEEEAARAAARRLAADWAEAQVAVLRAAVEATGARLREAEAESEASSGKRRRR